MEQAEVNTDFFQGLVGRDLAQRFVKSQQQKRLEERGWEFITNEIVTNYLLGIDYNGEERLKDSLKRMKEDYQRQHPGRRIGIFRAYNSDGERISCPVERDFRFMKRKVTIAGIYVRSIQ